MKGTKEKILSVLCSVCYVTFIFFPIFWIFLTSIKNPSDIVTCPPKFIFSPTFKNYFFLFQSNATQPFLTIKSEFLHYFLNTIILAGGSVGLTLLVGIPAAYVLAQSKVKLKENFSFVFLTFRFLPPLAIIIPLYTIYKQFRLFNTFGGLIFIYQLVTLPLFILITRSFFTEIPSEIIEASYIDGANSLQIVKYVALPLIKPGLIAAALLSFIFAWNNFIFALILGGYETSPIAVGMLSFMTYEEIQRGPMAAAAMLGMLPAIIFSIFGQRFIVRGLTLGAIK